MAFRNPASPRPDSRKRQHSTSSKRDQSAHATARPCVITTGRVLSNGTIIELIRDVHPPDLQLLIADGKTTRTELEFEYEGTTYVPAPLNPAEWDCMQIPTKVGRLRKTAELFERIRQLIQQFGCVEEPSARLAAHFALSTWFVDVFSQAPLMVVTGSSIPAQELLRILSCFCRRAMVIAAVTPQELTHLPLNFCPTLLVDASMQSASAMRTLIMPASSDFAIRGARGLVRCCSAKAIYSGKLAPPLTDGGIRVATTPRGSANQLSAETRRQIAEQFQPELLAYRVAHHGQVVDSDFDVSEFACAARSTGRTLGRCIVDDSELQAALIPLLQESSEAEITEWSSDVLAYVVEALLVCCHNLKPSVHVHEVAETANMIMQGRGENIVMNPREVGEKMRSLGLPTKRLGAAGRGIRLTQETCTHIHRLAVDYRVRTIVSAAETFPCCASATGVQAPA